ncbi:MULTISPECIES: dephospho-CoA kinase [unclassified Arsukibacterium]|uniref:dephospho-CoA kinase n=1 Tax=unclassified Arsukibacterium TaxID=2635278 RepID=UPI000C4DDBE2|nr:MULTISPECIES: dephospho-CoA kinase [unclassified Arsukibacterium]MAA96613.1 dephospho-CoA kinase [Rheinheimera sp.]MBM34945.1 dephospho-CoA kinase [Rheinheimera sp.]HAW93302.1 dephospho-CoA kinase [Candidatus Azambacteria bacterium]
MVFDKGRFIVGLTGGIGSGKSTVARLFNQLGIPAVDADIVAREVVAPGSPLLTKITEHFGPQLLTADNGLNRALLRQLIFNDPAAKKWLDNLMHPAIRAAMLTQLQQLPAAPYVLLIAPLLLENNLQTLVDRVLVVDITEQNQLARTLNRDAVVSGSDAKQVQAIIASQISRPERLALADDIIDNNIDHNVDHAVERDTKHNDAASLQQQVQQLHHRYKTLAANV